MAHFYEFKIGTTQGGMAYLEELTVPVMPPRYIFRPYSQALDLGDGSVRGGGWISTDWIWNADSNDFIPVASRNQLRVFCPGASAEVFIQTYTNDQDPVTPFGSNLVKMFRAIMIWPEEEKREAATRQDFMLKFRRMVQVT